MEKIILSLTLKNKLNALPEKLFYKEYFGFIQSAKEYVNKLINFIYTIPHQPRHVAHNPKHGKYYVRYDVKNKRTSYYITFNIYGNRYLIKNIFTSHESGYATYIKGMK